MLSLIAPLSKGWLRTHKTMNTVDLIAHKTEHCSDITEVICLNPPKFSITFHVTAWVFIVTASNFHDRLFLYTVHCCLWCAVSNYKITTYIDNEENCNNPQGTCCTVSPEYPIYRNIDRYMDRRSARMNPKGYNCTLKQRKISHFNSLLGSNNFQW